MDTLQNLWNDLNAYMHSGFYQVNALQGLLIAIGAAYLMHRWANVFAVAAAATVVHVMVDVMLPVLANSAPFRLPPLVESEYWRYLLTLYVGYLLVITSFFVVKRVVAGRQHA
mgnify:CR=1 FL=1